MTADCPDELDILLLAGQARSRDELFFTLVNRTTAVCAYDRASLWQVGRRPTLVAVSGTEKADPRAPFALAWTEALRRLRSPETAAILASEDFTRTALLEAIAARTQGLSAVWQPIPGSGMALLFERWGAQTFTAADASRLGRLAAAFAVFWPRRRCRLGRMIRSLVAVACVAAVVVGLIQVRLPLRVVATCEVTARSPRLIAAPMDGVIDEVLVLPGQRVAAGTVLARYDSRLMEEELKISRRQVAVVEAELAGARARGFSEARYRGETALLEARLEQELARLEALEVRYARRVVTAPVAGMVQLDDARAWRGRPVATGQAILWLVDPEDTRLNIWLPQDDRIEFDTEKPVRVHLHAVGGEPRLASVTYISSFAQPAPDGGYAFVAEAEWLTRAERAPPLGLRGTASLYGDEVSLGFWLFRRPMASVRRWLGV
ncbi:MAG: HlyD family efflux transporter periplasmic adaptor subunit [Planctomycetes bacterium]|nr:HlyD family efflux transporter periplasmic adaptor subunit [Planctomycetota bacterium]